MILVLDNIIPKKYQDEIENLFFSKDFNWNIRTNLVASSNNKNYGQPGFVHQFFCIKTNIVSEYYQYILPLLYSISEKSNVNYSHVLNVRTYVQTPSPVKWDNDYFHIDVIDPNSKQLIPHFVFLYYVNDSDGDTLISSKVYENGNEAISELNLPTYKTIKPKKGRVVVFDGKYYHAAGIPHEHTRCIINFDVM